MKLESNQGKERPESFLRPGWANESDFATERSRLIEDKRDKIREIREERQRQ